MKQKKLYSVTGMHCAACVGAVQSALEKAPGVERAEVSLLEGRTTLLFDDASTTPERLQEVVRGIGYDMIVDDDYEAQTAVRERFEQDAVRKTRLKLIVTAILAILMMTVGMHPGLLGLSSAAGEWINLGAASIIYFWAAFPYHDRALKQLRHGTFTMDTLISMSVTVAYVYSLVRLFTSGGTGGSGSLMSYFDVIGMIMTFVLLGRLIEDRAKYRTSDALRKLMALAPDTARVLLPDGRSEERPVAELFRGDTVLLRQGDRVPVDGLLIEGGSFDESSLTGEPIPVEKEAGEKVFAGTVSVGRSTSFSAETIGSETLLGRIIRSVREAQATKAPIQRIADKVSSVFVPVILGIALLTLLLWGFLGGETGWLTGLYHAISVMVIACPCALGLATPTAITVSMGKASQKGLLVRDAVALERLGKVTDVIFDKTGTLTEGHPVVKESLWLSSDALLPALLSQAETRSGHPLARALTEAFAQVGQPPVLTEVTEVAGGGVRFLYEDEKYFIGSREFVPFKSNPEIEAFEAAHASSTLVYFAREGRKLLGLFALDDALKEEAGEAVQTLSDAGITVHLLSGDSSARVTEVARELGIARAEGGQTPLDKKAYIEALRSEGKVVAMAGDGINDSPALAAADLSIAMGNASDIATDVAQVTAIGGSPASLKEAVDLSKRTIRIIHQNFFWAFIYNFVAVPIAAGLFAPAVVITPMIAAAAMAMSSVSVVANSLRLKL